MFEEKKVNDGEVGDVGDGGVWADTRVEYIGDGGSGIDIDSSEDEVVGITFDNSEE